MNIVVIRIRAKFRAFGFDFGKVDKTFRLPFRMGRMLSFSERGVSVEIDGETA